LTTNDMAACFYQNYTYLSYPSSHAV
jgi:hypothetical protein